MDPGALPLSPTVLVTGATDGIGRETALELARRGARVVAHGRSADRLARLRSELERIGGVTPPPPVVADFTSLAEVRRMAAELSERGEPLHVLVNNAGVYINERVLTRDGIEQTLAVNHFAPFVLTLSLLAGQRGPALRRIVNVSSIAHTRGRVDPEDAAFVRRRFDGYAAYAASKLANALFTAELARRLGASGPTVNALHPGVVTTKLLTEGFDMKGPDTVGEGARTSVFLALDPAVAGVTGRYFVRCREARPSKAASDPRLMRRFWDASVALTGAPDVPAG